jgi:hypothetical protein
MMPQQEACSMQDVSCFAAFADANTRTMYTDLTGSFPVRSFKNMQYIFVAYVYDLNAIIVRAMPTRTNAAMITAFKEVIKVLQTRGYHPALNGWITNTPLQLKGIFGRRRSTSNWCHHITIEPTPLNKQLPPSKNTSLPPLPQLTSSATSSFGMSSCRKLNSR